MAVGVESSEAGVAMEFPVSDEMMSSSSSPPRMPRRLRRRLLETKNSPATVEEIQAKLRHADLRRQKFYENLSSKARPKPRSPSQDSPHEEDLGQRLEAKLQAAEQKRLSILAKAQMRLAKLDESRQAAKIGAEMRFKKERAELGTKVESRVQQAEANRLLILKAHKQRRAKLTERTSESLLRRMARENKYKERVHAAIFQKRAAAEKKRLGLLEAEKRRARARMLQVQKVAKSVSYQREIERRKMKDNLENRLQKAKRQRAEYLSQRGRLHSPVHVNWNKMQQHADRLSRKLARCWRQFHRLKKPTLYLAKAYDALKINLKFVRSMPFEQLALLIESSVTLQTVKALLDRLEIRYMLSKSVPATTSSSWDDIDHLLKRVASPKKRCTPRKSTLNKDAKKSGQVAKKPVRLSRYQVRVVLCAYMILAHPDAVFSGHGDREIALAKSAEEFVQEFELLVKIILDGPTRFFDKESGPGHTRLQTFRSQLAAFDGAWCSYLNSFVLWKVKDARSLEDDLVRAACQLELSMIQACKMTLNGDTGSLTHDMKAIQKQVTEDQKLLREKVHHLSGHAGVERMECAISETRMKFFQAKENGSPVGSPVMRIQSPSSTSSSAGPSIGTSDRRGKITHGNRGLNPVARSLFQDNSTSPPKEVGSSASSSILDSQRHNSSENLSWENELIVNEILHEQQHAFGDGLNLTAGDRNNNMKAKIKETMEKAFWDGIIDSMKQDNPNYDRVVELMREVRDEICGMAPPSWKEEIFEAIDVDILSQVLGSGKLDMNYLGKILEFALITLRKLSAPASEDDLKVSHLKLLKELAEICQAGDGANISHIVALIKGLRFVLEQIEALKQEIGRARIKLVEPLVKGVAGFDYLKNAFASQYGPPPNASTSLPLTMRWLSSLWDGKDEEWQEHRNALLELTRSHGGLSQIFIPSNTLRTGGTMTIKKSDGRLPSVPSTSKNASSVTECKGDKVDLLVRLGLLKLVSGVPGLTQEALPESLKLNFPRLRAVQAQLQKIIVICTSVLVLRQTLITEHMVPNSEDMESMASRCAKQLSDLLDSSEDAGIKEIVEVLGTFAGGDGSGDPNKLQSLKNIMARLLTKSLQAEDRVFLKVSHAVYRAARGVVLEGNGQGGRELAEAALRQVGAAILVNAVVECATVLVVAATVSCNVHGSWYEHLIEKM